MNYPLITVALALVSIGAVAGDLSKSHPQRKQIITSVKAAPELALASAQLDIRRLWASDKYAFLCALALEGGTYHKTDDAYEIYQVVLARTVQGWEPIAEVGHPFVSSPAKAHCISGPGGSLSDSFLAKAAEQGRPIARSGSNNSFKADKVPLRGTLRP